MKSITWVHGYVPRDASIEMATCYLTGEENGIHRLRVRY